MEDIALQIFLSHEMIKHPELQRVYIKLTEPARFLVYALKGLWQHNAFHALIAQAFMSAIACIPFQVIWQQALSRSL
ncbi:MAG: hypothetical protein ACK424_04465 [Candidatus Thermochlorobacter sp.]